MFGKYNGFVSKARVSACMYFLVYIEVSQIYKSIFKLTINYSNSHIVQDERKQISCDSPLAWRRLPVDAAWMQLSV
jgi:hypothetical protein